MPFKKILLSVFLFCCVPLNIYAQCDADGLCNQAQVPASIRQILTTAEKRNDDDAFIKGATAYYNLVNTYTAMLLAESARKTAQADLTLAEEKFSNGESNSFAVTSSKTTLLGAEAALLQATRAWVAASADLSLFFKKKPEQLYIPGDVDYNAVPGYVAPDLHPAVDLTRFDDLRQHAEREHHRVPDYELEHALVLGHTDWYFNGALREKTLTALQLAQTNLHQTKVSFETGLSSQHDVMNAELLFNKAQAEYLKAAGACDLSRLRLLEGTGTLEEAVENWLESPGNKI